MKTKQRNIRDQLIHEAATQEADGEAWRDRLDEWLAVQQLIQSRALDFFGNPI